MRTSSTNCNCDTNTAQGNVYRDVGAKRKNSPKRKKHLGHDIIIPISTDIDLKKTSNVPGTNKKGRQTCQCLFSRIARNCISNISNWSCRTQYCRPTQLINTSSEFKRCHGSVCTQSEQLADGVKLRILPKHLPDCDCKECKNNGKGKIKQKDIFCWCSKNSEKAENKITEQPKQGAKKSCKLKCQQGEKKLRGHKIKQDYELQVDILKQHERKLKQLILKQEQRAIKEMKKILKHERKRSEKQKRQRTKLKIEKKGQLKTKQHLKMYKLKQQVTNVEKLISKLEEENISAMKLGRTKPDPYKKKTNDKKDVTWEYFSLGCNKDIAKQNDKPALKKKHKSKLDAKKSKPNIYTNKICTFKSCIFNRKASYDVTSAKINKYPCFKCNKQRPRLINTSSVAKWCQAFGCTQSKQLSGMTIRIVPSHLLRDNGICRKMSNELIGNTNRPIIKDKVIDKTNITSCGLQCQQKLKKIFTIKKNYNQLKTKHDRHINKQLEDRQTRAENLQQQIDKLNKKEEQQKQNIKKYQQQKQNKVQREEKLTGVKEEMPDVCNIRLCTSAKNVKLKAPIIKPSKFKSCVYIFNKKAPYDVNSSSPLRRNRRRPGVIDTSSAVKWCRGLLCGQSEHQGNGVKLTVTPKHLPIFPKHLPNCACKTCEKVKKKLSCLCQPTKSIERKIACGDRNHHIICKKMRDVTDSSTSLCKDHYQKSQVNQMTILPKDLNVRYKNKNKLPEFIPVRGVHSNTKNDESKLTRQKNIQTKTAACKKSTNNREEIKYNKEEFEKSNTSIKELKETIRFLAYQYLKKIHSNNGGILNNSKRDIDESSLKTAIKKKSKGLSHKEELFIPRKLKEKQNLTNTQQLHIRLGTNTKHASNQNKAITPRKPILQLGTKTNEVITTQVSDKKTGKYVSNKYDQTGDPLFAVQLNSIDMSLINSGETLEKIKILGETKKHQSSCCCISHGQLMAKYKKQDGSPCVKGPCDIARRNRNTNFTCNCLKKRILHCSESNCKPSRIKKWPWKINLCKSNSLPKDPIPLFEMKLDPKYMNITNAKEIRQNLKILDKARLAGELTCKTGVCNEHVNHKDVKISCFCTRRHKPIECGNNTCDTPNQGRLKKIKLKPLRDIVHNKFSFNNIRNQKQSTCLCKRKSTISRISLNLFRHSTFDWVLKKKKNLRPSHRNRKHRCKCSPCETSNQPKELHVHQGDIDCPCFQKTTLCTIFDRIISKDIHNKSHYHKSLKKKNKRFQKKLKKKHEKKAKQKSKPKPKSKKKKMQTKAKRREQEVNRKKHEKLKKIKRNLKSNERQKKKVEKLRAKKIKNRLNNKANAKYQNEYHKKLQMDKDALENVHRNEYQERKKRNNELKQQLKSLRAQRAGKEETAQTSCFADLIVGVVKLLFGAVTFTLNVLFQLIFKPRISWMYFKTSAQNPFTTYKRLQRWMSNSWTLQKMKMANTIAGSDNMTVLVDTIQDTAFFQAFFARKGKTKEERMDIEKENKRRKLRIQSRDTQAINSCRHALLTTLRKRPCLWVYHICPNFYPQCLSCLQFWRKFSHLMTFLVAVIVWTPCLCCVEMCRFFICCFVCTA